MNRTFTIRRMKEHELHIATEWAQKEGWNPGINDDRCFYQADPNGFFIGLLDDEPIATGSAVVYDKHFAFCGLYIVKPEYRRQGYGIQLTHERLKYVDKCTTGIDGVLENVAIYQKIGYQPAHKNTRYAMDRFSKGNSPLPDRIIPLSAIPFEEVERYDRRYFPAFRTKFLQSWIAQPESYALGYVDGGLTGYGVMRKCRQGYKIGPLFAESLAIARQLFETLCSLGDEGPIYLDVPEPNKNALRLVDHFGMKPTFEVIRMYRNGTPDLDLAGIYGITTFELG